MAAHQPATTLADHVRELRIRFFGVAVVFLLASCLAYVFRAPLLDLLLSPLNGQKLVYLSPAGGFNFILLISIYAGLAITIPLLIHQLYAFLKPALPGRAQHYAGRLFLFSFLLLVAGVAFGYYLAIPGALHFLYSFADNYVVASLTADSYLNFILVYTIGLGIVFQLPLLVLFFHWIKPLTPGGLLKSERWVILLAFVAAAIITPTPDPLNQSIIALPVIVVYQVGVAMVLVAISKQRRRDRKLITMPIPANVSIEQLVGERHLASARPRGVYALSVDGFTAVPLRASPKSSATPVIISPRPVAPATIVRPRSHRSIDGVFIPVRSLTGI